MASKRPILVTGSHRSGTTWVGKMIALSPSVGYISEPFNISQPLGRGICNAEFGCWFRYITEENEAAFYGPLRDTMDFRFNLPEALKGAKSIKGALAALRESRLFSRARRRGLRPLVKDPIAFFSSEWLAKRFDMEVLVMIRHPAAFANSLKSLGWAFDFRNFLDQPLLMRNLLKPFETEIKDYVENARDIVGQAALLWKIIHHVALRYRDEHKDWMFFRHEDLSKEPVSGFENIFGRLDLEFTPAVREVVEGHSSPSNPVELRENPHAVSLNSRVAVRNWKKKLTEGEIARVREVVEEVSREFYSDNDW